MDFTMIGLRDAELSLFLWEILMTARITLKFFLDLFIKKIKIHLK